MKVLIHHYTPFALAHGGLQIQITQTREALLHNGVETEFLRWYDSSQTGDVLHFFGRIPTYLLILARRKGIKIVISDLLGGAAERSRGKLWLQRILVRGLKRVLSPNWISLFDWDGYELADACVALTPWEAHLMSYLFGAPANRIHVVPNGVEDIFLKSPPVTRGKWLLCTATITPRKRVVELAQAAVIANTPLWVLGKAYADSDAYSKQFTALARKHPEVIRYHGALSDREELARTYRQARGFVLLSRWESLSLSALEPAACECPLLLSDFPSARGVFKERATYCRIASPSQMAVVLRRFYDAAPQLALPAKPATWTDIALQLKELYESIVKTSR